jgi:hypothetical protein
MSDRDIIRNIVKKDIEEKKMTDKSLGEILREQNEMIKKQEEEKRIKDEKNEEEVKDMNLSQLEEHIKKIDEEQEEQENKTQILWAEGRKRYDRREVAVRKHIKESNILSNIDWHYKGERSSIWAKGGVRSIPEGLLKLMHCADYHASFFIYNNLTVEFCVSDDDVYISANSFEILSQFLKDYKIQVDFSKAKKEIEEAEKEIEAKKKLLEQLDTNAY